jgi:ubiquinone/menaquinone biosynthesis C-methylase UbiE
MSVERYLNKEITPWTGEHLHRYFEAKKKLVEGDIVLDLACGSGYGSAILSEVKSTRIYGGDIEEDIIIQCKYDWADNPSLIFEKMDATNLKFEDKYFDKVISLETIEHLTEYKQMVSEFSRVLKPSGIAVISTPNISVSSPDGKIVNPYHTQEFTYEELEEILKREFKDVVIYGQKYTRYLNNYGALKRFVEELLLTRGIRKLPYSFRNKIFTTLFQQSLYPVKEDFQLFSSKEFVKSVCHVLFAVCKK